MLAAQRRSGTKRRNFNGSDIDKFYGRPMGTSVRFRAFVICRIPCKRGLVLKTFLSVLGAALLGLSVAIPSPAFAQSAAPHLSAGEPARNLKSDQDVRNSQLLAAAEQFEVLTEQAFSAKPAKLLKLTAAAEQAANNVQLALSTQELQALDRTLAKITQARKAHKPHELALAAVEGYRILVSGTKNTTVPAAVNLLDYAGFRYQADLRSTPTRWQDMQAAVQFAQQQWQPLKDQITEATLKNEMSAALAGMESAVSKKSAKTAQAEVKKVLDLVDRLESYFNPRK
jgi:hypothetical protein